MSLRISRYGIASVVLGLLSLCDVGAACGQTIAPTRPPPAPLFAGRELAAPPESGKTWTPPPAQRSTEWESVVRELLKHGFADPRGCEYREVELTCGSVWSNVGHVVKTHAWVIPNQPGEPAEALRFAVAWNGLVYPAIRVGAPADWRADFEQKQPEADLHRQSEARLVSFDQRNLLKAVLLSVLGEADAAAKMSAEFEGHEARLYLAAAHEWGWALFDRAICAHLRGDDDLSLESAKLAAAWGAAVEAEGERRKLERPHPLNHGDPPRRYLEFLQPVDELIADEARRVASPPVRRVLDPDSPRIDDAGARIAALIRDLEVVDATQWSQPGGIYLGREPLVLALEKEGTAAVEPLLECLANDRRLTRSVGFHRDFGTSRYLIGVEEAAFAALSQILKTRSFGEHAKFPIRTTPENRRLAAAEIRKFWETTKGLSDAGRWYATLADAEASQEQWLEAAQEITGSTLREPPRVDPALPVAAARAADLWAPLKGESLRERNDPSVSQLLDERAEMLTTRDLNSTLHLHRLHAACDLTLCLARWDRAASLPVLRRRIDRCRALTRDKFFGGYVVSNLGESMSQMVMVGMDAAVAEFFDEYVGWLNDLRPDYIDSFGIWALLKPMARYPDDPKNRECAAALFAPNSIWFDPARPNPLRTTDLYASGLIGVPAFREMVKRDLHDESPYGTVQVNVKEPSISVRHKSGSMGGTIPKPSDADDPRYNEPIPIRHADFVAWRVSFVQGAPAFEIYWPEARRTAAVLKMLEFLDLHGNAYADRSFINAPQYFAQGGLRPPAAKFQIAKLDRVAEQDDVASGRAVFVLDENDAKRRVVELPKFPQAARWTIPAEENERQAVPPRQITGNVWQAEEIDLNGTWRRYYGFVGNHVIARVLADQIELIDDAKPR